MPKFAGLRHRRTWSGAKFRQIGHGAYPLDSPAGSDLSLHPPPKALPWDTRQDQLAP